MIKVSVIIPTYRGKSHLRKTIQSLKNQKFEENYEIIIVDNSSDAEIKQIVEEEGKSPGGANRIIYVEEPNIGLHNARHRGAKIAEGEILVFIDDDVEADPNLLKEITKPYDSSDVGCVGGKILPKWECEPPEWINLFPKWYLSILDDEDGPKEVQWIYGCNFSIRKELLFELGGFNPDAFGEKEMWWCRGDGEIGLLRKVHSVGKKIIYNPDAVVWHFIPKRRLSIEYFKERAFKSGIEASFSKYRYDINSTFNPIKIILRVCVFFLYYVSHGLLGTLGSIKHKITSSYYKARCLYELRLVVDKNLQRFVKTERWLK